MQVKLKGWMGVLVLLLLPALPILLPVVHFAVAKGHLAELEQMLASQITFRQAQDVARVYEEGKAAQLSQEQLAEQLAGAAEQMKVRITHLQARGDMWGRIVALVKYVVVADEESAPVTRCYRIRYSWQTGWRLGTLREVDMSAFTQAPWR